MHEEIILAGFGGQGVLLGGLILAQAALENGKHTTWFPSYGAEIRGGTAKSAIVISDNEIGSPVILKPSILLALNEPSLNKFIPTLRKNGLTIINSSLAKSKVERKDIKMIEIPATEIALNDTKNIRTANSVMIGALLAVMEDLKIEYAKKAVSMAFSGKDAVIEANYKALDLGYNFIKNKKQ